VTLSLQIRMKQQWEALLSHHLSLIDDAARLVGTTGSNVAKPKEFDDWKEATGVEGNARGDLHVFFSALVTNSMALVLLWTIFSFLRRRYPQVYANNVRTRAEGGFECAPCKPSDSLLGWVPAGLFVTRDQARKSAGTDTAMLLEFSEFAMKLLFALGVPLVCIFCPLHYFCGGGRAAKVGDRLSTIGANNIEDGNWLFWLHAPMVWYVVAVTETMIFNSMEKFLAVRFEWLLDLEPPQSTTLLVEGIPEAYCSDDALQKYFSRLFPDSVESAYIVKRTEKLEALVNKLKTKRFSLEKLSYKEEKQMARCKAASTPSSPQGAPPGSPIAGRLARPIAGITRQMSMAFEAKPMSEKERQQVAKLESEVAQIEAEARQEKDRLLLDASQPMSTRRSIVTGIETPALSDRAAAVNTSSGFVTFTSERETMLVLNTRLSADIEDFKMSIPPQPNDIMYKDLMVPKNRQKVMALIGYGCTLGVFWSFLPFIVSISSFTRIQALQQKVEIIDEVVTKYPSLGAFAQGVLSTLALVLFMSFLPTVLMTIFSSFYCLKAHAWAQLKLQNWYFWFMVIFILLITALGGSLVARVEAIYKSPSAIFGILADSLPTATNFYLNYMIVQWVTHGMNLTRYVQLTKYLGIKNMLGEERAVELAEPEDQDYYGIGSRSARWAFNLVVALVFCSLCPLITVLTFVDFLICRIHYGYLTIFAETRKHDLGGPFFVQQLWHVQCGLILYVCLMTGIMIRRAGHWGPCFIVASSLGYVLYSLYRFQTAFKWKHLPFDRLCTDSAVQQSNDQMEKYKAKGPNRAGYKQPALCEETWKGQCHGEVSLITPRDSDLSDQA